MDAQGLPANESEPLIVEELRAEQETEVMEFLGERPSHTFGMTGFIRSNGLVSPHNQGAFYGCRNALRAASRRGPHWPLHPV